MWLANDMNVRPKAAAHNRLLLGSRPAVHEASHPGA
jgi:hypothetical protein